MKKIIILLVIGTIIISGFAVTALKNEKIIIVYFISRLVGNIFISY